MNKKLKTLLEVMPEAIFTSGSDLRDHYTHIWKMQEGLDASLMITPENVDQLSVCLKILNDQDITTVVHGGRTNLVGGTETNSDCVVISLAKMNKIIELDPNSRTITVEAGTVLEHVHEAVAEENLIFPLSFGAKGSAQIGGILSTNAGGLRVLRYGMAKEQVLGLEVVLADGTILSNLRKIIKDNSGYDLKQLFMGSEGTLGIITKAVLKLREKPSSRVSALLGVNHYKHVIKLLKHFDSGMSGTLSGFELMWNNFYSTATSAPSLVKPPLSQAYKYYVLVEGLGSDYQRDLERLSGLLEQAMENEWIEDAVLAQSDSDLEWFWKIREDVHVAASQCQHDQHFDISIPIGKIGEEVDRILRDLSNHPKVEKVVAFGHVADGNIHFIVGKSEQNETIINEINDIIYQNLRELKGSVSAEHGIGVHKKAYLSISKSESEIALMKTLKRTLDPNNILNPGKIFDL